MSVRGDDKPGLFVAATALLLGGGVANQFDAPAYVTGPSLIGGLGLLAIAAVMRGRSHR